MCIINSKIRGKERTPIFRVDRHAHASWTSMQSNVCNCLYSWQHCIFLWHLGNNVLSVSISWGSSPSAPFLPCPTPAKNNNMTSWNYSNPYMYFHIVMSAAYCYFFVFLLMGICTRVAFAVAIIQTHTNEYIEIWKNQTEINPKQDN